MTATAGRQHVTGCRRCRGRDERGAGTVLVCLMVLVLVALTAVAIVAVSWMSSRREAATVADLSALAAAHAVAQGEQGCATAHEVARRNRARVTHCSVVGAPPSFVVRVAVAVDVSAPITGGAQAIEMTSEAGPG